MRRSITVTLFMALLCLGLAPAAHAETVFTVGVSGQFGNLDPQEMGSNGEHNLYVYQGLVDKAGDTYELVPSLAASWELVDPLTWKFKIRQGVKFHNGQAFTARDAAFSINRMIGQVKQPINAMAGATWKRTIAEVTAPDDETLIVKTKEPEASLLTMLRWIYMLPQEYVERLGNDAFAKSPVGTGAFKIESYNQGQSLTLTAFKDYWNTAPDRQGKGPAQVDKVIYRTMPQEQTRVAALAAGEISATAITSDTVAALKNNQRVNIFYVSKNQPFYVMFNWYRDKDPKTGQPNPYTSLEVRRALNHAVDVDALIENFGTGREVKTTLLGTGGIGYNPEVPRYEYNPQKARELLAQAGYPNGFKTKFNIGPDAPNFLPALLQFWRNVGIAVERVQTSPSVIQSRIYTKKLEGMVIWSAGMGGEDPAATWFKTSLSYRGPWAMHGENDRVEELVEAQTGEMNQEKRAAMIDEVVQILWRDAWFVPLWEPVYINAVSRDWDYDSPKTIHTIYLNGVRPAGK